jgi:demethylmenaquinone methyltransferase/2-methoxy-6-polyprenyl-1,4-benzoquinol methylase
MNVLPTKEAKRPYVKQMFADIAPTYDTTNRVMTFGMDQDWRQYVVERVAPPANGYALDLGTGTGDFLPMLAAWMPTGVVVGVDSCLPMMEQGKAKLDHIGYPTAAPPQPRLTYQTVVSFIGGDATSLPFADNTFDAITTGFTIRNVPDIAATFRELWRVARRGAVVACLEVAQPRHPLLQAGHQIYFKYLVPRIGGLLSGNKDAYVYLHQSARHFPPPDMLARVMREAGWQHVRYSLHSLGAVAIHTGVKI